MFRILLRVWTASLVGLSSSVGDLQPANVSNHDYLIYFHTSETPAAPNPGGGLFGYAYSQNHSNVLTPSDPVGPENFDNPGAGR